MKKKIKKNKDKIIFKPIFRLAFIIVLSLCLGFFVQIARAVWTMPPNSNIGVPLGIGQIRQEKTGWLKIGTNINPITVLDIWGKLRSVGGAILNSAGSTAIGLLVQNGNTGIGTTTPNEKLVLEGGNFLQTGSSTIRYVSNISDADCSGGANECALTSPFSISISSKYAYVSSIEGFAIIDISNPSSPTHVGSILSASCPGLGPINSGGISVSGKYAYVSGFSGFAIIDISNPTMPVCVGSSVGQTMFLYDIYISGNYAYTLGRTSNEGFYVYNIANPSNIIRLGYLPDSGSTALGLPNSIYVSGKYAYISSEEGLEIIDISNPYNPMHAGALQRSSCGATCVLGGTLGKIYVSGKYAYVSTPNGLAIIDISDPSTPTHVKSVQYQGGFGQFKISGKYVYSSANNGMIIIDISNPTNPFIVSNAVDCGGMACPYIFNWGVEISGKYLYTVGNWGGMAIFDISGIDAPTANIGSLFSNNISVSENMDIGNNLYVRSGINVGSAGIKSDGPIQAGQLFASTTIQTMPYSSFPACNTALKGSMFYYSATNKNCYCDGSAWKNIWDNNGC